VWGPLNDIGLRAVFQHTQINQTAAGLTSKDVEAARYTWVKVLDAVTHHRPEGAWLDVGLLDTENVNPYWSEIEHCHNFTYARLRELLRDHGFEPLSCSISNHYRVCMDVGRPPCAEAPPRPQRTRLGAGSGLGLGLGLLGEQPVAVDDCVREVDELAVLGS
jgi:hypothetical protein